MHDIHQIYVYDVRSDLKEQPKRNVKCEMIE